MILIAVDPGSVSGAYAIRFDDGTLEVGDLPVVDGQVDAAAFSRFVRDSSVTHAVVERVGAMPGQGVTSTFRFGFAAGIIRGVLAANGIPVHYVTPGEWKKHFKLYGRGKDKGGLSLETRGRL